jgi:hypothetical protein
MMRSMVHVPSFLIGIATSVEIGARRQWRTIVVEGVRGVGRLRRLRVWRGVVLGVWRRVGVRVGVRIRVVVGEELVDGGGGLVVWWRLRLRLRVRLVLGLVLRLRLGVVVSVMGSRANRGQVIIAR